jgi:hypothetical protein
MSDFPISGQDINTQEFFSVHQHTPGICVYLWTGLYFDGIQTVKGARHTVPLLQNFNCALFQINTSRGRQYRLDVMSVHYAQIDCKMEQAISR